MEYTETPDPLSLASLAIDAAEEIGRKKNNKRTEGVYLEHLSGIITRFVNDLRESKSERSDYQEMFTNALFNSIDPDIAKKTPSEMADSLIAAVSLLDSIMKGATKKDLARASSFCVELSISAQLYSEEFERPGRGCFLSAA